MTYEIEQVEPSMARCDCCDGLSVRLTRFVYRDGDAYAIYYSAYTNAHPGKELAMLVSLGGWGEGSSPSQRVAFYCHVRPTAASFEVALGDAATSSWSHAEIVGEKLSADQAREHPWKESAYEVLGEALSRDVVLKGFATRYRCGALEVPLEHSFGAPDDIFALGDGRDERVMQKGGFAVLDDARFFLRCLLPIPVERYGTWCVGLWVELTRADYEEAKGAWNDPPRYASLRCSATIANDLQVALDLPVRRGDAVELYVSDPDAIPMLRSEGDNAVRALLAKEWQATAFEAYAVSRGFL